MTGVVSESAAQATTARKQGLPVLVVSSENGFAIGIAVGPGDIPTINVGDRAFVAVADETLPEQVEAV